MSLIVVLEYGPMVRYIMHFKVAYFRRLWNDTYVTNVKNGMQIIDIRFYDKDITYHLIDLMYNLKL